MEGSKVNSAKTEMRREVIKNGKQSKTFDRQKFVKPLKKRRKNEYDPKEESRLERIVFGDPSDIINNLSSDEDFIESHIDKFDEDTTPQTILNDDTSVLDDFSQQHNKAAAWVDDDDEQYSVQDAADAQGRIMNDVPENLYTHYLHRRYKQIVGTPKWAELKKLDKMSDDLDNDILKHSCHLEKPKVKNLRKGIINLKSMSQINKQTHTEGPIVSSVEFHPTSTVAIVGGSSGILSLFQVDGNENNKLHSIQYNKFPISSAKFLKDGTEVLIGSQYYSYCHCYDLLSGKTCKQQLPYGITNLQKFEVSPDGKLLAICGRTGEIFLLTTSSKELVATFMMNARCRSLCFTPDSKKLITHGESSEMYVWDLSSRVCVHRVIDDGCLSSASIAMSPSGQFLATGSKEGVVNLYDTKTVLQSKNPKPLKVVLNLVTSITSLKFNPHSEILAMASNKKHNAFKMLHLPSFTVFSNFPTLQTNISLPETIDFSPGSGYLTISNRSYSAFLFRLQHYENY